MSMVELLSLAEVAGPWLGYVVLVYLFVGFVFGSPETRALDRAIDRFDKRMEQLINILGSLIEATGTKEN